MDESARRWWNCPGCRHPPPWPRHRRVGHHDGPRALCWLIWALAVLPRGIVVGVFSKFQRSCFDNPIAGVLGTSLQGIKIRCQVAVLHACILLLIVTELNFHQTSDWSLCYPRTEDECHVIDMQAALEKTGEAWFLCCKETKEAATHTHTHHYQCL